jgi:hypothetical protein
MLLACAQARAQCVFSSCSARLEHPPPSLHPAQYSAGSGAGYAFAAANERTYLEPDALYAALLQLQPLPDVLLLRAWRAVLRERACVPARARASVRVFGYSAPRHHTHAA